VKALGHQIIAEFYDCDGDLLADVDYVTDVMLEAAKRAKATIVTHTFHHFSPLGVSGAIIIAESHLAIHTWPEYGYAAVDLFTCGDSLHTEHAFDYLRVALKSGTFSSMSLERGHQAMLAGRRTQTPLDRKVVNG
jgi:S-adenosylmethionine decarboxylase